MVSILRPSQSVNGDSSEVLALDTPVGERKFDSLQLVVVSLAISETPIAEMEEALRQLTDERVHLTLAALPGVREVGALRTCQRIEFYVLIELPLRDDLVRTLGSFEWRTWNGIDAVRHLFRVAGGLESVAVGEQEVRTQLRRAASRVWSRHPRPVLKSLFQSACSAADALPAVSTSLSVAALAAAKLLEEVGQPFPRVLIVGSGQVGRKLVELLASSARLTIVYHRSRPSDEWLRSTGARGVPINQLADELLVSDAAVTAAKSAGRLLGVDDLRPRERPLVLLDLGVPRNVDPTLGRMPGVRLWDIKDLQRPLGHRELLCELTPVLDRKAEETWLAVETALWEPGIAEVWRAAEAIRQEECSTAGPFLGPVTPDQRAAVELLTRRLIQRLFGGPMDRVRNLPLDPTGIELRRRILELLTPQAPRS